ATGNKACFPVANRWGTSRPRPDVEVKSAVTQTEVPANCGPVSRGRLASPAPVLTTSPQTDHQPRRRPDYQGTRGDPHSGSSPCSPTSSDGCDRRSPGAPVPHGPP